MIQITILVDNVAIPGYQAEHGLALWIETQGQRLLFDTGAGQALLQNAAKAQLDLTHLTAIFLSHGHYDHTGALAKLSLQSPIFCGPKLSAPCYSLHTDTTLHEISLPITSRVALAHADVHVITQPTEIAPHFFSTGPIARTATDAIEQTFYCDAQATCPNTIPEEHALIIDTGVLITGCCHAGIINTVQAYHHLHLRAPLKTLIGGLHLLHATDAQLMHLTTYLNALHLERLILLHCTGEHAKAYLLHHMNCTVILGKAGDRWTV